MECNDLELMRLDQDGVHWRDVLDMVVNFGFHERRGTFISWKTATFPKTVLHKGCYFLRYVSCELKILHRCWDNCDLLPYCNIYWFTTISRELS
jgi:hypothetical protein